MSIYARNFTVDEETGEVRLIKHLNKIRVDSYSVRAQPCGWNKTGKKARINKRWK